MSSLTETLDTCQVVVLVSGNGSNLQSILDTCQDRHSGFNVVAVISNEANAYALIRAKRAGVATHVVSHRHYASRDAFDAALHQTIERYTPDLVVLAGFMRILGKRLVFSQRSCRGLFWPGGLSVVLLAFSYSTTFMLLIIH